ncbi:hypothetical protein SAMN05421752_1402 [Natronorubrum thiooxidans]|uniref:Uncharacterized protein n=1 Tax=Natronorubrum thiooxidans TaxID=308853 RepID=A0A1N7H9Z7_9EURY|nr:hypothetical protein SAMN05421752_1402 [Natronorubrum thiooxidans]
MRQLQILELKSSRKQTVVANSNHDASHAFDDGITLDAEPTYDRRYDSLLTLEETVRDQ